MSLKKTSTIHYKWLKVTGIIIGLLLVIIILVVVWLQTSWGKDFVRNKVAIFLQGKFGSSVIIGKLDYSIPYWVRLDKVILIDKQKDTLLYGESIKVNINMIELIAGKIVIPEIYLKDIRANVNRKPGESSFNYQYIIDAFAPAKKDTSSKKPLQFTLGKLIFDTVTLHFNDQLTKLSFDALVGNLESNIKTIDLDKMNFEVNSFILRNSSVLVSDKSSKNQKAIVAAADVPSPFNIKLHNLSLNKIIVSYVNQSSNLNYYNAVDTLNLNEASLDLMKETFSAKALTLDNSAFSIATNDPAVIVKDTIAHLVNVAAENGWDVKVDAIHLNKNSLAIDNNAFTPIKEGMDYNHLKLNNISLQTNKVHYHADTITGNVLSGTVLANNFLIKDIKGDLVMDSKKANLKGFVLTTQNSSIAINSDMVFNTLKDNQLIGPESKVNLAISKSDMSYSDLLFFFPTYKRSSPFNLKPNQKIFFTVKANGTMKDLNIGLLDMKTDDSKFQLNTKGTLKNVMDIKKLQYNLAINKLYVDKTILSDNIQHSLMSQGIDLPTNIQVDGRAAGSMDNIDASLKISSPYGLANISGTASNFSDIKKLNYNIDLTGNNLLTGKWISQDSLLGLFTGNIKLSGNGTDYKKSDIKTNATINSLVIKGEQFTNLNLNAAISKGDYTIKGNTQDDKLVSAIDLKGTLSDKYPTITGTLVIDKADLTKLKLSKDSVTLRSYIIVDAKNLDPKNLNGVILLDSTIVTYNGKLLYADTISIKANSGNDSTKLFVKSPFIQADMIGKYDYENLPTAISAYVQHNFFKHNTDTLKVVDQQMVLHATITEDSIMNEMIPSLALENPAIIKISFDNTKKDTALRMDITESLLGYGSIALNALKLNAYGHDSSMNFTLATDYMMAGGKKLYKAGVVGDYTDNAVKFIVKTEDEKKKSFYAIGAVIQILNDDIRLHLADSLLLNYAKWNVTKDNLIDIKDGLYKFTDFTINRSKESIEINNENAEASSPIQLKINQFNLSDLFAIANQDTTIVTGLLNIDAKIAQPIVSGIPAVIGTVGIQNLAYEKVKLGDLALKTEIASDKIVSVKGDLTGPNNLSFDGGYNVNDNNFSISTQVKQLNLKVVEAFSQGQIIRANGNIHGDLFVNGNISDPHWQGVLYFDTTQIATAMFGSLYKINNQKVDFDYPNIGLYDFTISDTVGNKLIIDGTVKSSPGEDLALGLTVNTKDFIAVNQIRTPKSLIYGIGIVDADLTIGGTISAPDFSGDLTLDNKSDIHYVVPDKNDYANDMKEVVKFIDIDTVRSFKNSNMIFTTAADTAVKIVYEGLKYNLNLEVQEEAKVTILIDPTTGDELIIKGKAELNAGVDENGLVGITGVYQLKDGSYDLTYKLIKKKFTLMDGSTITFSGNPLEAQTDITAQYEIETSPQQLLSNEVSGTGSDLGTAYSNKVPFEVILKMKGSLLKPILSFDIKVKDNADNVNSALATTIENKLDQFRADTAEMNKQVFALLIFGRFIGEKSSDFFASSGAGGGLNATDIAKESVSKFLAQALNQIASDLIKGVDISLDLKNYQADAETNTATRTDVNLALSKQLLNDRLIVTVGKSFTVEGETPPVNPQDNGNMQFLPDISTTYKLSKDGMYALKAYRKNQYEAILDGYFTETGLTFSITMSYDKLKEILRKNKIKPIK